MGWHNLDRPHLKMRFERTLEVTELVMQITEKTMFQAERMAIIKDLKQNIPGFLFKKQEGG